MLCKNSLMDCICCFENICYEKMNSLAMMNRLNHAVSRMCNAIHTKNSYINPTLVLTRPPPKFRNTCPLLPLTC